MVDNNKGQPRGKIDGYWRGDYLGGGGEGGRGEGEGVHSFPSKHSTLNQQHFYPKFLNYFSHSKTPKNFLTAKNFFNPQKSKYPQNSTHPVDVSTATWGGGGGVEGPS